MLFILSSKLKKQSIRRDDVKLHSLIIQNLGPIKKCDLKLNDVTVLTGPQSSGKSTIAKAVFFNLSIKQDILDVIVRGGVKQASGDDNQTCQKYIVSILQNKFYRLFGTQRCVFEDMYMKYDFSPEYWMITYVNKNDREEPLQIKFSDSFIDYFDQLDNQLHSVVTVKQKKLESDRLSKMLCCPFETVFIPAGRSVLTLLSPQINYIYTIMDDALHRVIDYVTSDYLKRIIQLKQVLADGVSTHSSDFKLSVIGSAAYKKHKDAIYTLEDTSENLLQGRYRCIDGTEERIYINEKQYVKINFASSGQQEIVWVLNILFYYLKEDIPVYIIIEEPETHLFPAAQQKLTDLLTLFYNEGNKLLITTHSPYVLGTMNYQLIASQSPGDDEKSKILEKNYWLDPSNVCCYHVLDGKSKNALDDSENLILIDNDLIDGASHDIDNIVDQFLDLYYRSETEQ